MEKERYHHGDLANGLITAALTAIDEVGPEAVSLRGLAEQLGVSRAAPYRHFSDRNALLAAAAARGFEELNAGYEAALAGPGDGRERLRQLSRFFLDFANRRPGLHKLMFDSDLLAQPVLPAVLAPLANRGMELLWRSVAEAFPDADAKDVKARTIIMMSTTHGFLAMRRSGRFKPYIIAPLSEAEIEEAIIKVATAVA